jgi:hypothetical protein
MGGISRGWVLNSASWDALKDDASLALFLILSAIVATLAMVSIWAPTLITRADSPARSCRPPSSHARPSRHASYPKNS